LVLTMGSMTMKDFARKCMFGVLVSLVMCSAAVAWEVTTLHEFAGGGNDGRSPWGGLTIDASTLYGMTYGGGDSDAGTIFSIGTDGNGFALLHEFAGAPDDGKYPYGSLTLSGSTLYGMTSVGGDSNMGTIFSLGTGGGNITLLHEFAGGGSDGELPFGNLTLDGSILYGMTCQGGDDDYGTIFSVGTDGNDFTILHEFAGGGSDGRDPRGSLTLVGSTLYGMTTRGGDSGYGTVFSIGTDGNDFTLLHEFAGGNTDGRTPNADLTLDGSTLYGMTVYGGDSSAGTVFSIGTDGNDFTLLHEFAGGDSDGDGPLGSLTLDGSTLYGMTTWGGDSDTGVLFSISTDGTLFEIQHEFGGGAGDGSSPRYGPLTQGGSLPLYGMTREGGANGVGVIFIATPEPGAVVLLALGAAGLAAYRRKRK